MRFFYQYLTNTTTQSFNTRFENMKGGSDYLAKLQKNVLLQVICNIQMSSFILFGAFMSPLPRLFLTRFYNLSKLKLIKLSPKE